MANIRIRLTKNGAMLFSSDTGRIARADAEQLLRCTQDEIRLDVESYDCLSQYSYVGYYDGSGYVFTETTVYEICAIVLKRKAPELKTYRFINLGDALHKLAHRNFTAKDIFPAKIRIFPLSCNSPASAAFHPRF